MLTTANHILTNFLLCWHPKPFALHALLSCIPIGFVLFLYLFSACASVELISTFLLITKYKVGTLWDGDLGYFLCGRLQNHVVTIQFLCSHVSGLVCPPTFCLYLVPLVLFAWLNCSPMYEPFLPEVKFVFLNFNSPVMSCIWVPQFLPNNYFKTIFYTCCLKNIFIP